MFLVDKRDVGLVRPRSALGYFGLRSLKEQFRAYIESL